MFTTSKEEKFFLSFLKKTDLVLEYGSGESTKQIADLVKKVLSIEHQEDWFNKIKSELPSNAEVILKKPLTKYIEEGNDGTYDQFKDYAEYPISHGPFDVILIDGRARVYCASICKKLGHKNTIVFIHDFTRQEYQESLNYLEIIDYCDSMYKFKIKEI